MLLAKRLLHINPALAVAVRWRSGIWQRGRRWAGMVTGTRLPVHDGSCHRNSLRCCKFRLELTGWLRVSSSTPRWWATSSWAMVTVRFSSRIRSRRTVLDPSVANGRCIYSPGSRAPTDCGGMGTDQLPRRPAFTRIGRDAQRDCLKTRSLRCVQPARDLLLTYWFGGRGDCSSSSASA